MVKEFWDVQRVLKAKEKIKESRILCSLALELQFFLYILTDLFVKIFLSRNKPFISEFLFYSSLFLDSFLFTKKYWNTRRKPWKEEEIIQLDRFAILSFCYLFSLDILFFGCTNGRTNYNVFIPLFIFSLIQHVIVLKLPIVHVISFVENYIAVDNHYPKIFMIYFARALWLSVPKFAFSSLIIVESFGEINRFCLK